MAGACRLDDGRVAFRPPCASRMMIGADVRRVAEINVRPFFLSQRLDFGVFFLEPLPHQGLIAFDRAMQWLLAGDADLRQQPANGIGGQRDVEFPLDQRRYCSISRKALHLVVPRQRGHFQRRSAAIDLEDDGVR